MTVRTEFSVLEALEVAAQLGIDFKHEEFDLHAFREGMDIDLGHGSRSPSTDVKGDDPLMTGRIALAHLRELPDYYERLARMEEEATAPA